MGLTMRKGIWDNGKVTRWIEWMTREEIEIYSKQYEDIVKLRDGMPEKVKVQSMLFKIKRNFEFTLQQTITKF